MSEPDPSISERGWLDRRLDLRGLYRGLLDRPVPSGLTWWHTLGSATLAVFLVQLVSGLVLAMFYAPSPDHAYNSIKFLEQQVAAGRVLRAVHHWGSSAMVVLALLHTLRVFAMGAYKYPREVNWIIGVGLLGLVLGFGFTGYLLPWDQRAYWATQVGTSIASTVPYIGGDLALLLKGGSQLGAATLTRFYAFHVLWLPGGIVVLIAMHLAMVVRQGIAAPARLLETGAPARTDDAEYVEHYARVYEGSKQGGVRFWPDIIAKDVVASLLVIVVLFVVAWWAGAPIEAPADPTDNSYIPTPEWYFLPFFQLLKLFPGSMEATVAIGVPSLLAVVFLGLPLFDRRSTRRLRGRPFAALGASVLLGGSVVLLGAAVRDAQQTVAPETGRVLSSVARAGRATFRRQCASCHVVDGSGGSDGPELTLVGARHSIAWLHSFIENPSAFHADSKMSAFGPPSLSHQEIEEIAQYLSALRGRPGKEAALAIRDTFPSPIPSAPGRAPQTSPPN
ncbi:MAG: cytochrome b N-terminal domain-containing protein [Gemmatimonadaceae bacterium]|nr:cytochrome b N-terminal domain-containing protein [Gemmatimonadaceae bacterium]